MRNVVIAKYLCRDPYYKFAVWQMIKTNGEYWDGRWHELRKLCEPTESIKDVPDIDLIIRHVVTWSYDNKPRPEDKHNRSRCYVISVHLHFLLDAMRDWIEKDVEGKGCKFYDFPEPEEVKLVKEAVN